MLHHFMERLARLMALLGGLVLTVLILLTTVSVLGRGLNTLGHSDLLTALSAGLSQMLIATGVGPISGDFELVEAGMSFTVFAFLPLCQIRKGHATVDIFASAFPRLLNAFLAAFWEVLLSALMVLIAWRLFSGMEAKMQYGETTFILQFPVWWAYALSFMAAVIAAAVSIYCAAAQVVSLVTGTHLQQTAEGGQH